MTNKVNVKYEVERIKTEIQTLDHQKRMLLDKIDSLRLLQDLHNYMAAMGLEIKAGENCTYYWSITPNEQKLPSWAHVQQKGEEILMKHDAKITSTIETDWMVLNDGDEVPIEYKALTIETRETQTGEFQYEISCEKIKDHIQQLIKK
jgi:hypothetical protein